MSASKRSTLPVWDGMVDCWSGYTAHALEYVAGGTPVAYGQGRIHMHWGILWGSRPVLFQLNMITSALGSNDWVPGRYNFASPGATAPRYTLSTQQQWQVVDGLMQLYTLQWDLIDANTESGEWVSDTHTLRDGTVERRNCSAHKIARSLEHLFETNHLNRGDIQ